MSHLITEAELEAAPWVACGQAALAALFDLPVAGVRVACPRRRRPWMNLSDMMVGTVALGKGATSYGCRRDAALEERRYPEHGFALIQFGGPWDGNVRDSLKRSHWIAVRRAPAGSPFEVMVFDVNSVGSSSLLVTGGWQGRAVWEAVLPRMLAEEIEGANGKWWIRAGVEVA